MTRGTPYLILPANKGQYKLIYCDEFNGDMYGSPKNSKSEQKTGHYIEMVARLKRVSSKASFLKEIKEFNAENHNYPDLEFDERRIPLNIIDFNVDYFHWWFSDYLFFKNKSGQDIIFICEENRQKIVLLNNEIATFNFGKFIESVK